MIKGEVFEDSIEHEKAALSMRSLLSVPNATKIFGFGYCVIVNPHFVALRKICLKCEF